jgi:LCP family protein required for cell wall assembly
LYTQRARGAQEGRSSTVAAFLSFLWPGLGQWYRGRPRAALLYAIPIAVVLLAALYQLATAASELAVELFSPSFSLTILILIVLLGLWRLVAMADAAAPKFGWRTLERRSAALLGAMAIAVVVVHGVAASFAWSFYNAGSKIFVVDPGNETAAPSGDAPALVATPYATPATKQARVNVLLTGIDSSPGRTHALNDTLIVASIDPVSHKVAMLSFPRDIANFPLWKGGRFSGKINSLMTFANNHKAQFPDGGLPSLIKELGYLSGVPIHYYAAVDLAGFRKLIDTVGGVDINNPRDIDDPGYGGWTDGRAIGFKLSAGPHHLDGQTALAYVRSRKGAGDSDFSRARRQQQLLVALARKLADPKMLPRLPDILSIAGDTVRTNFPADRLTEMIELSHNVDDKSIRQVVLGPPYSTRSSPDAPVYTLQLDFAKLAALSMSMFGPDSAYTGVAPGSPPPQSSD